MPTPARGRAAVLSALIAGAGLVSAAVAPSATAQPAAPAAATPAPDTEHTVAPPPGVLLDPGHGALDEASPVTPPPAAVVAGRAAAPRGTAVSRDTRPTTVLPVSGYRVSARYGSSGGRWSSGRHTGLDFDTAAGAPVRAVAAGRVVSAGWDGPYGRAVVVAHADGTRTRYAHLSSIAVAVGDRLAAGTRVGRVGSTGNATGSHLHLEVLVGDGYADPARWLRARGVRA